MMNGPIWSNKFQLMNELLYDCHCIYSSFILLGFIFFIFIFFGKMQCWFREELTSILSIALYACSFSLFWSRVFGWLYLAICWNIENLCTNVLFLDFLMNWHWDVKQRCPMGTSDCSKLSQRSGEICYVAPDYANYEALEKWCGNWLFVIDEV